VAKTSRTKLSSGGKTAGRKRAAVASATTKSRSAKATTKSRKAAGVSSGTGSSKASRAVAKAAAGVPVGSGAGRRTNGQPSGAAEVQVRPIPTAVPTDSKPRKNAAGLNSRDLEHFRDLLLAKRRELVGDMSQMEREALRSSGGTNLSTLPMHMADMGTDNYEQEFTLGLVEKDRNLLREINQALAKIQNGTYGICEGTGKPIGRPRLEAQPWARYSIEHARQLERGIRPRPMFGADF